MPERIPGILGRLDELEQSMGALEQQGREQHVENGRELRRLGDLLDELGSRFEESRLADAALREIGRRLWTWRVRVPAALAFVLMTAQAVKGLTS